MYTSKPFNWTMLFLSVYDVTEIGHLLLSDKKNDNLDHIYNQFTHIYPPEISQWPQFSNPTFMEIKKVELDSFNENPVKESYYHRAHETEREEHIHQEIVYENLIQKPESGFSPDVVHHITLPTTVTGVVSMQMRIFKVQNSENEKY